jgi:hypothetical protein
MDVQTPLVCKILAEVFETLHWSLNIPQAEATSRRIACLTVRNCPREHRSKDTGENVALASTSARRARMLCHLGLQVG